ncbi:MAG TPA: response regulator [Gemmataceae bacterium]|nr:response regulator [Gemmataceae bacterium]
MNAPATGLRIAVADDEDEMRRFFEELLPLMGHEVVAVVETGKQLAECCRTHRPDVVVTDIKMPDMDGIDAAAAVNRYCQVPVVLVSGHTESELLARSGAEYIMSYLVKPVKPADLQAAITLAVARFEQYQRVRAEADSLRQALEDRKTIEQSKGVVMRRLRIDEPDAYHRMRRVASQHNWKLVDLAHRLLDSDTVFKLLEETR